MSKDYTGEIGYESLLADFGRYQKQTPRGVGMTRKGQNIYLQFKTTNAARKPYACNCTFTLDGMVDALKKSNKVAEALKDLSSESEFWQWYEKEIKQESQLANDRLTFEEAIKKVEDDFWSRPDRRKKKRSRNNPSHIQSWKVTYGNYYRHLPLNEIISLQKIEKVISKWKKGTKLYGEAVSAMRKLTRFNKQKSILLVLEELDTVQTDFTELQTIDLEQFIEWKDRTEGITSTLHKNSRIDVRKAWLWVFSTQIVYALRISEVFAIKNLFEPYVTKDGVLSIPALNDASNTDNLIYIGEETAIGTTVKTGSRLARPQIPPKYPNLIDKLSIKTPLLPVNKPESKNTSTLTKFYAKEARKKLVKWGSPKDVRI
ncbi:hypothetical protein [Pleurocapsa sp. FMAR1]|uniref:hypothetical protein n=1 Tax=Pleurocapsa sp. FMAR1 TaxID=3040204 RepID=UPI0029C74A2A|nr:hypothetical protein [Pleurocapsa sp. FMAR1]